MQCVADCNTDHPKLFEQPVIQTLQMFVGESGCWLVVLISFLLRRFSQSPSDRDISYHPVGVSDSEEAILEQEDEGVVADLEESQTLVDPTNIVAKPIPEGAVEAKRRPVPTIGTRRDIATGRA